VPERPAAAALALLVALACFLGAWLGLGLVPQPMGVALFWPAARVAAGAVPAVEARARPWTAAGARQRRLKPETVDLGARLEGMLELLRHSLGSRVAVETDLAADLWPVTVDPGLLEIAVLNLR
jgi:hypothetical protein